jgi:hypothetical protein
MSRICLLMAVAVAAGVVGCAQCDTCDDFPAPCVGPNCGQLMPGGLPGYFGDNMGPGAGDPPLGSGAPSLQPAPPSAPPASDSASPAPASSAPAAMPTTPAVNPASPPVPTEPGSRPN